MPKFKKGSLEAKEYMASMRMKRKWENKKTEIKKEVIPVFCVKMDFQEFYSQALKEFNEIHGKNPISELEEMNLKLKGLINAVSYLLSK